MSHNKRPNYFNHQFLDEKDFQDEQAYHLEHRRIHNRTLHRWGIVEGLTVESRGGREVVVHPGLAIDHEGREIVVSELTVREVPPAPGEEAFVTVTYHEHFHKEDLQGGETAENYRRVTEAPEVHVRRQLPPSDGSTIELARIHLDAAGNIREVDLSNRVHAGALLARRSVNSDHLADEAVTRHKLAANAVTSAKIADDAVTSEKLAEYSVTGIKIHPEVHELFGSGARGWVRCVFKPAPLEPREEAEAPRVGGGMVRFRETNTERGGFTVELTHSFSGARGARGSMTIPVPAGARKILAMRVAGVASSRVEARLVKIGWNTSVNQPQAEDLVMEMIETPAHQVPFNRHAAVPAQSQDLRAESDAVAIAVIAHGESQIWLVAAEFA